MRSSGGPIFALGDGMFRAPYLVLGAAILSSACVPESGLDPKCGGNCDDPRDFFENSRRRGVEPSEAPGLIYLDRGCAGFFVANSSDRPIVMTARHCLDPDVDVDDGHVFDFDAWCAEAAPVVVGSGSEELGEISSCSKILATAENFDMVLFELDRSVEAPAFFRLATYRPVAQTPMEMIGFPADAYRNGSLTVTDNCWLSSSDTANPFPGWLDPAYLHNCTVYGGNSGGPMLVEGSDVVVGMPYEYTFDDYVSRDAHDIEGHTKGAYVAGFLTKVASDVSSLGLVTVADPVDPIRGDYLPSGLYSSPGEADIEVTTNFESSDLLDSITVGATGTVEAMRFYCYPDYCESYDRDDALIVVESNRKFLLELGGDVHRYTHVP